MPSRPSPKAGVYVNCEEDRLIIDLTAPKEHRKLLKRVLKAAEASDAAGAGTSKEHAESEEVYRMLLRHARWNLEVS